MRSERFPSQLLPSCSLRFLHPVLPWLQDTAHSSAAVALLSLSYYNLCSVGLQAPRPIMLQCRILLSYCQAESIVFSMRELFWLSPRACIVCGRLCYWALLFHCLVWFCTGLGFSPCSSVLDWFQHPSLMWLQCPLFTLVSINKTPFNPCVTLGSAGPVFNVWWTGPTDPKDPKGSIHSFSVRGQRPSVPVLIHSPVIWWDLYLWGCHLITPWFWFWKVYWNWGTGACSWLPW